MLQTLLEPSSSHQAATCAEQAAAWNRLANVRAIRSSQLRLANAVESLSLAEMEWVFARDGALTAIDANGRWWSGCTLPMRAAKFMFQKADLTGVVVCMLTPAHAAQARVVLDKMRTGQALLALMPDLAHVSVLLHCDEFAAEIAAHRLYFAWGEDWQAQLDLLLAENPGLATPSQFVRPIVADSSSADALMPPAQKIFNDHGARRSETTRALIAAWRPSALRKICLVAPSHFRLWDGAGSALASIMSESVNGIEVLRFDSDDPASASPLALAMAATHCNAIVTPNLGRADLPELAPIDMPWATWLTIPRIPSAAKAGARDTLLVADPDWKKLAVQKGWSASRVFIAGWPDMSGVANGASGSCLAIISDTRPLDPPAQVAEYSSHRLLWEAIASELLNDPFQLGRDSDTYLSEHIRRAGLDEEGLDRAAFIDGVVRQAYQQGLAALLISQNIPVKLYGQGWDQLCAFKSAAAGAIESRAQLQHAVDSGCALVHVWPTFHAHAIESLGKPVLRAHHRKEAFIRDAKLALVGKLTISKRSIAALTAEGLVAALSK